MVDPARGKIYWANRGNNTIGYANLDGSGGGQLSTEIAPIDHPIGVAINPKTGWIYWANNGDNTIGYVALNGSSSGSLGGSYVNGPAGIAINPRTNTIYWANNSGNAIGVMKLTGAGSRLVDTGGATADQPGFPVLLEPPRPGAPASISGGSKVGTTLRCSTGGWAADIPASFLYQRPSTFSYVWTRGGTVVGTNSPMIVTHTPGQYVCHVTAANQAGAVRQRTAIHEVSAGS